LREFAVRRRDQQQRRAGRYNPEGISSTWAMRRGLRSALSTPRISALIWPDEAEEGRMTKQEAVEKVTKALLRDSGYPDHNWREYPKQVEAARQMVVALDALGVHRLSG